MHTFLLMYIAVLFSLYTIAGQIIFINGILPIIALFFTVIFFAVYKQVQRNKKKTKEHHGHTFHYHTQETDTERKARVNAEVDKIIEEQRNNKKQS